MVFDYAPVRKNVQSFLFCAAISGAALSALPAHAATVVLNNGDQITGTLLRLTDSTLVFESSIFGEVSIPWGEVDKLVSDQDVQIRLTDGTALQGKLAMKEDGVVAINQGRPGESTLTRENIAALNPPIIDNSVKYSGHLDVGGAMNRGNSTDNQLNLNGQFSARTPQNRYTVSVEVNEADSGDIKTTSNRRLAMQYDAFLTEKNYLFVNAKAERDRLADLNLRSSIGAGYGRQFIETEVSNLSGQAGVSYVNEDYNASPDQSFPTLSLGLKYERKFLDEKLVYFQNLNMDTSLDDADDTLLRSRLGLRIPIANGVNLSTQFNVDYDNQPADGKKKTDTALIFSVGYGF